MNRPCSLTARRAGVGRVVAGGLPAPGYPSVGDGAALAAHLVYVGFTTAPVRDVGLRGGMTERRWLR